MPQAPCWLPAQMALAKMKCKQEDGTYSVHWSLMALLLGTFATSHSLVDVVAHHLSASV
jgi:hypothetical protein